MTQIGIPGGLASTYQNLKLPVDSVRIPGLGGRQVGNVLINPARTWLGNTAVDLHNAARSQSSFRGALSRGAGNTLFTARRVLARASGVARGVPLAGTLISAALEIPRVLQGFEDGRGLNAIMESGGAMAGAAAGAVAGQAAIPIPIVGAVIGGAVGYFLGDKAGDIGSSVLSALGIGRTENEQAELDAGRASAQIASGQDLDSQLDLLNALMMYSSSNDPMLNDPLLGDPMLSGSLSGNPYGTSYSTSLG